MIEGGGGAVHVMQENIMDLSYEERRELFLHEIERFGSEVSGMVFPPADHGLMKQYSDDLGVVFDYLILKTPWESMNYKHWDFGDSNDYRLIRITFTDLNPPISIYFHKSGNVLCVSKPTLTAYPGEGLEQLLERTGYGMNWFIVPDHAIEQLKEVREKYFPKSYVKDPKAKAYQKKAQELFSQPIIKEREERTKMNNLGKETTLPKIKDRPLFRLERSVDEIVRAWEEFRELDRRLLTEDDYQEYRGSKFKKKSAFRKYKLFYSISDEILKDDSGFLEDGSFYAEFWVMAWKDNRPEYKSVGIGIVYSKEKCNYEDKEIWNPRTKKKEIKKKCPPECNGLIHFSYSIHNIKSTAHTRAKNRAISDLIAGGEVSYEEIVS